MKKWKVETGKNYWELAGIKTRICSGKGRSKLNIRRNNQIKREVNNINEGKYIRIL